MRLHMLLNEIAKANDRDIDYILNMAMERKRELYPDWELFYCAAPKNTISGPEDMIREAWEFNEMLKQNESQQ